MWKVKRQLLRWYVSFKNWRAVRAARRSHCMCKGDTLTITFCDGREVTFKIKKVKIDNIKYYRGEGGDAGD